MTTDDTLEQWLRDWKAGDEQGYVKLMRHYKAHGITAAVRKNVAKWNGQGGTDIDDVLQMVDMAMLKYGPETLNDPNHFKSRALKMANQKVIDLLRKTEQSMVSIDHDVNSGEGERVFKVASANMLHPTTDHLREAFRQRLENQLDFMFTRPLGREAPSACFAHCIDEILKEIKWSTMSSSRSMDHLVMDYINQLLQMVKTGIDEGDLLDITDDYHPKDEWVYAMFANELGINALLNKVRERIVSSGGKTWVIKAFVLIKLGGYSHEEVADILGVKVSASQRAQSLVMSHLRDILGVSLGGDT